MRYDKNIKVFVIQTNTKRIPIGTIAHGADSGVWEYRTDDNLTFNPYSGIEVQEYTEESYQDFMRKRKVKQAHRRLFGQVCKGVLGLIGLLFIIGYIAVFISAFLQGVFELNFWMLVLLGVLSGVGYEWSKEE